MYVCKKCGKETDSLYKLECEVVVPDENSFTGEVKVTVEYDGICWDCLVASSEGAAKSVGAPQY